MCVCVNYFLPPQQSKYIISFLKKLFEFFLKEAGTVKVCTVQKRPSKGFFI